MALNRGHTPRAPRPLLVCPGYGRQEKPVELNFIHPRPPPPDTHLWEVSRGQVHRSVWLSIDQCWFRLPGSQWEGTSDSADQPGRRCAVSGQGAMWMQVPPASPSCAFAPRRSGTTPGDFLQTLALVSGPGSRFPPRHPGDMSVGGWPSGPRAPVCCLPAVSASGFGPG